MQIETKKKKKEKKRKTDKKAWKMIKQSTVGLNNIITYMIITH